MAAPKRSSKQTSLAKYLSRIMLIVAGVIVLLYFLSVGTLKELAVGLAGRIIVEVVERESNGFYEVSFDEINIRLLARELEFKNFQLSADSASRAQFEEGLLDKENMYTCQIPSLKMQIRSLYGLYFNRELHVSSIELFEPEVQWRKSPREEQAVTLSLEAGDFYQLVTEYLYHFEISDFKISNGNFLYVKDVAHPDMAYHVGPVNASVENFKIDQEEGFQKDRFLNTENLSLQIMDQVVKLSDSIHVVKFDELTLSTVTSDVVIKNLQLRPREEKLPVPDSINSFEVLLPLFRIQGVDFIRAYNENVLDIGDIYLEEPTINIFEVSDTKRRSRKTREKNSLIALITSLFDAINVENFDLDNALLDLKFYAGKNQDRFTVQNARVKLDKFEIDTSTVIFDRENKLFDHIDFSVDHYAYFLPDSIHRLHIKSFRFSTLDSLIRGDSLVIAPMEGLSLEKLDDRANVLKDFYVPSFELTGVELWKGWENKDLSVKKLSVDSSEFYLKRLNDPKRQITFREIANFYPYIEDIFNRVSVDSLVVQPSKVDINDRDLQKFSSPAIAVYATSFRVDSLTQLDSTNFFHASDLLLQMGQTKLILPDKSHLLNVGEFTFNPIRGDYAAANVRISPYYPVGWSVEGTISKMKMTSFFLKEFLDEGKWLADSVFLYSPDLKVTFVKKGRKVNNSILNQIKVEALEVRDGLLAMNLGDTTGIQLNDYNFSFTGLDYDIDKDSDWSLKTADADVASLFLSFPGNRKINMDTILFSVTDSVFVGGLFSYQSPAKEGIQKFSSPAVQLSGIDIPALIKGNFIKWDKATIAPADIVWTVPQKKKGKINFDQFLNEAKEALLGEYRFITGRELVSPIRSLNYLDRNGPGSITAIHLAFYQIYMDQRTTARNAPLGFAENIELSLSNESYNWTGKLDSVYFDEFKLSTQQKELIVNGFYLKNSARHKVSYEASVPQLVFKGVEWKDGLLERNLFIDTLEANLSFVTLDNDKLPSGKEEDFLSFEWQSDLFKNIRISELLLNGKVFNYSQKSSDRSWQVPEYSVLLKGFQLTSGASVTSKNLLFSNNYLVVLKDLNYLLPDSLYRLQADQLVLSSQEPAITLEGFRLLPRYGMYEHAHVVGHQTNWTMLKAKSIAFSQSDLYELLNGGKIKAAKIEVEEPFLRFFRDKRVPFPESQVRGLPQMQLLEWDQVVEVDSLTVKNGTIIYLEFAEEGNEPGQLIFSEFNAKAANITNVPSRINANPYASVHAEGLLMEQGSIEVDVVFDLTSKSGNHYVSGVLGPINLEKTNAMLEPTAFVEVKSGNLNEAYFTFEADSLVAIGSMDFLYKDLKVSVLSKTNDSKKGLGKSLETFFANTFIINSNNPSFLSAREGYIFFERDTSRSIINYWAKAFLSGVVGSIGAKNNKDKVREWKEEVYERNSNNATSNGNEPD